VATDETDDPRPDDPRPDNPRPDNPHPDDKAELARSPAPSGVDDVGADEEPEPTLVSSADLLARATGGSVDGSDSTPVDADDEDDAWDAFDEGAADDASGLEASPIFRGDRRRVPRPRRPSGLRQAGADASARVPGPAAPRGGFRVRRVRRLVRHIEPWSVLKVGLVFYLCVWGLMVIATRMLWSAADEAGTIEKVESFIEELFALETFEFDTSQIFRIFVLGGLVLVVGGIGVTVVLVVLFNLISDLTGGVRFTMVEEETAVRQRRLRRGDVVVPPGSDRRSTGSPSSSEASPGADTVSGAPGL